MTRERALWEAVATVAIPSLIIWGVLFFVLRANARADEWPLYLIFLALPLPLIFPIYKRYLRGPKERVDVPGRCFFSAIICLAVSLAYVVFAIDRHRDKSDLVGHLIMGLAWLLIGADNLRRGMKASKNLAR